MMEFKAVDMLDLLPSGQVRMKTYLPKMKIYLSNDQDNGKALLHHMNYMKE